MLLTLNLLYELFKLTNHDYLKVALDDNLIVRKLQLQELEEIRNDIYMGVQQFTRKRQKSFHDLRIFKK